MASQVFNVFKTERSKGTIDLENDDIRVAICMSNTTVSTQNAGILTVDDFDTLDEADGSGYSRQALSGKTVTQDDTNNRAEFDANDSIFLSLGAGSRATTGALVYKHVTDDTDSIPICWVEFPSTVTHTGVDFTIAWNSEGILQN